MKIKTADLTGPALDWAVTKCELPDGWPEAKILLGDETDYSTSWAQGGPIIEQEMISVWPWDDVTWKAETAREAILFEGTTPLIAAMRCFVASKLGHEVEIPEELDEQA
jgi:hypothetical protein